MEFSLEQARTLNGLMKIFEVILTVLAASMTAASTQEIDQAKPYDDIIPAYWIIGSQFIFVLLMGTSIAGVVVATSLLLSYALGNKVQISELILNSILGVLLILGGILVFPDTSQLVKSASKRRAVMGAIFGMIAGVVFIGDAVIGFFVSRRNQS